MLAVPLLREDEIIGALIVRRTEPGAFPDRTVELLETLASQSAVAIHNARLYSELARKSGELEVAGRHKSEFLASMSHELRTPLNAVIGFSDVLLERMSGELNERQEEYVVDIRDSGRHLLELINEILDLSKVEAGRMELDPGPLSLPDLLEQGLAMVRERAERGGLAVTLDVAPDVGVVWADELKLKQVVINLLTNAVKFTPDGGAVEVTARVEDDEVQVTVRDTGIGIAEHERERIFEAFQRGDRPARSTAEGTGLGLTLSRRIVELHGGRLWLTSRPGSGQHVRFRPATPPRRRGGGEPGRAAGRPGGGRRRARDRGRPALRPPAGRLPRRRRLRDPVRPRRGRGAGAGARAPPPRGRAGHPAAARRRLGPARAAQGRPGDRALPRGHRLDPRRARQGPLARRERLPGQAGRARAAAGRAGARERAASCLRVRFANIGGCPMSSPVVLIVEDNARNLKLVRDVLAHAGYRTLAAEDGEAGIALAREHHPDAVLMDIGLPGIDGVEALARLRAEPGTTGIPVAALTAFAMREDRERLLAAGFDGYVEKPVSVRDLPGARRRADRRPGGGRVTRRGDDPARRRPAAEPAAPARRCSNRAATPRRRRARARRRSRGSPRAASTSSCSTS